MAKLQQTVAPNLPLSPEQFERIYQDQLNNILRLYFNRLESNVNNVIGPVGGQYLSFPCAAIQRTTDKTFTANIATEITFDQIDFLNGCTNDGTDGIIANNSGIYNYQFSVQFANTDSQAHNAWIWLRINGVDVEGTGSRFDVPSKHGTSDGYLIAACNFYVSLKAGDSISMYAAVSQAYVPAVTSGVYMEAYAAKTTPFAMPAIPSVVATLTFVSEN